MSGEGEGALSLRPREVLCLRPMVGLSFPPGSGA